MTDAPTSTTIDPQALAELRSFQEAGEPDIVAELILIYLEDMPQRVADIVAAVQRGDAASLSAAAHALKSSSAQLGALRLSDLCRQLEERGRTGRGADNDELRSALQAESERVAEALQRLAG